MKNFELKITLFLCLSVIVLLAACQQKTPVNLQGTYERMQQLDDSTYVVQLQLTEDSRLLWTPVDSTLIGYASAVQYEMLPDNQLRIFGDEKCGSDAVYSFTLTDSLLTLTTLEDNCEPRARNLIGDWIIK